MHKIQQTQEQRKLALPKGVSKRAWSMMPLSRTHRSFKYPPHQEFRIQIQQQATAGNLVLPHSKAALAGPLRTLTLCPIAFGSRHFLWRMLWTWFDVRIQASEWRLALSLTTWRPPIHGCDVAKSSNKLNLHANISW